MSYQNLLLQINNKILTIIINRESKLNALNKTTLSELNLAITEALQNSEIGGIIITGAGEKAFVAGADIAEFSPFNMQEGKELAQKGQNQVFDLIENSNKPIIAAINGFALGGGLELAMACHIRIAADHAKLGLPETSLGLIPGYGGTQRLPQLVGKGKAFEMILSADMISADEGLKWGLVNQVVNLSELLITTQTLMARILLRSPEALSSAIIAINSSTDAGKTGFQIEIEEFGKCFNTLNFKEGVKAFLEKRKPDFK